MFHPGQEVECIVDLDYHGGLWDKSQLPKKGERFIVRWCGKRPTDHVVAVMLNEITGPLNTLYNVEQALCAEHFRAIQKTDISVLEKLCHPKPIRQLEDA